ncbi:hypothetical protein [Streptomyces sp. NPDC091027]|uniref:hypothetical protein n=1 Tax=Streptomyces sp. NPDC091027 TaxID=3365971 RepID=UPI00382B7652
MAVVSNPKFDPRMTAIPQLGLVGRRATGQTSPGGAPIGLYWRGSILRDNSPSSGSTVHAHPKAGGGDTYRVDFLFNPSTITVSHESGAILTEDQRTTDGQYIAAGGIGQVSFNLLYDRTYEMTSGGGSGNEATKRGVLADMEALYRVTGVYDVTAKGAKAKQLGPMQSHPCYFYFGGTAGNALSYYGYISQMGVQYTHFTGDMIPQRCAVNLTVELTQKGIDP